MDSTLWRARHTKCTSSIHAMAVKKAINVRWNATKVKTSKCSDNAVQCTHNGYS